MPSSSYEPLVLILPALLMVLPSVYAEIAWLGASHEPPSVVMEPSLVTVMVSPPVGVSVWPPLVWVSALSIVMVAARTSRAPASSRAGA